MNRKPRPKTTTLEAGIGIFKPTWAQSCGIMAVVFGMPGVRLAMVEMQKFI